MEAAAAVLCRAGSYAPMPSVTDASAGQTHALIADQGARNTRVHALIDEVSTSTIEGAHVLRVRCGEARKTHAI